MAMLALYAPTALAKDDDGYDGDFDDGGGVAAPAQYDDVDGGLRFSIPLNYGLSRRRRRPLPGNVHHPDTEPRLPGRRPPGRLALHRRPPSHLAPRGAPPPRGHRERVGSCGERDARRRTGRRRVTGTLGEDPIAEARESPHEQPGEKPLGHTARFVVDHALCDVVVLSL
jgi:hypothetical protein